MSSAGSALQKMSPPFEMQEGRSKSWETRRSTSNPTCQSLPLIRCLPQHAVIRRCRIVLASQGRPADRLQARAGSRYRDCVAAIRASSLDHQRRPRRHAVLRRCCHRPADDTTGVRGRRGTLQPSEAGECRSGRSAGQVCSLASGPRCRCPAAPPFPAPVR